MSNLISVNTFWTIWLLVHLLLSVGLLGALTHQAASALLPVRKVAGPAGFVTRFRAVQGVGYATAVCIMWVLTFIVGAYIYAKYRIYIRIPIEQSGFWKTQGFFDFKEHVASIGLVLLPVYWFLWKNAAPTASAHGCMWGRPPPIHRTWLTRSCAGRWRRPAQQRHSLP